MVSEPRTRDARARAEEALIRLALLAGSHANDFVVIGGLNPDFLAPAAPRPHLGTTDVDLLLEVGFVFDRDDLDFSWLDRALRDGSFMAKGESGWQWDGVLGDSRVRVDLLCDVADNPGQPIALPGAAEAAAQNLRGPAVALNNPIRRELDVPARVRAEMPGAPARVALRFASLGGYLVAKSAAFISREQPKDAYDLAFVLMYAPGGPRAAAAAVSSLPVRMEQDQPGPVVESAVRRLANPDDRWVPLVVRQLQEAGDDADPAQLKADVLASARRFLTSFRDT